jgi:ketosteroid isomerase-like protein
VLCECKWRSKKTGKVAESHKADSWRFGADGRVIEFYEYFDTATVIEAETP